MFKGTNICKLHVSQTLLTALIVGLPYFTEPIQSKDLKVSELLSDNNNGQLTDRHVCFNNVESWM